MFKGMLMFVLLGAVFALEMFVLFCPRLVTIKQVLKTFLPRPLRFMVYAWLGWHFIISDLVKQIQK